MLVVVDVIVVWLLFFNLWLYGGTFDVVVVKEVGVWFCFGFDWVLSGIKHVLGELKVVLLVNVDLGVWLQLLVFGSRFVFLFSDFELCCMVMFNLGDVIALVVGV